MCTYEPKKTAKVGPKTKISPKIKLRIKRVISTLQSKQEKINSRKNIEMTGANVSIRTIQRQLQCMQFKHKRISGIINLTKQHKEKKCSMSMDRGPTQLGSFRGQRGFRWMAPMTGELMSQSHRKYSAGNVNVEGPV